LQITHHARDQTSEDELEVVTMKRVARWPVYQFKLEKILSLSGEPATGQPLNNRISKFKVPVNLVLDHAFGNTKSRSLSGVLGRDQSFANHPKDHSDKFDKSRLVKLIGDLGKAEIEAIEKALRIHLEL
jgi:hypothetical protein